MYDANWANDDYQQEFFQMLIKHSAMHWRLQIQIQMYSNLSNFDSVI